MHGPGDELIRILTAFVFAALLLVFVTQIIWIIGSGTIFAGR